VKRIYHIAETVAFESGGLRPVIENLDNYLNREEDFSSVVLTNAKEDHDAYIGFAPEKLKSWNYSPALTNYLLSQMNDVDILHLHGVFMHAHYASAKIGRKNNIPYVVTPHGMLEPWHLKDKKLKKKIYRALVLDKLLAKSKILHAITPFEKENLYKLSGHKTIFEIPNFLHYEKLPHNLAYNPEDEYLLFLSRIHPKKGLDILLQSMAKINDKKIKLKIVGTTNPYAEELKRMAKSLGIENRVEFVGGVFGNEKYKLFANAKVFIAPSYSEAIGMVNLEAAACNTPVITSFETGISPEWNNNGGIMIHPNTTALTEAMNQAIAWSDEERRQRGALLSDFVLSNYSWEKQGHLWNELYNAIH